VATKFDGTVNVNLKYRAEIDGLRAVAVLPVILFHAGFEAFSGGYVGVDVFFVISGFLITQILLNDLDTGTFSLVKFYERRARRILPALFFVVICCIPFAWLWMLPSQARDFSQSLIAVSLFASNFLFWSESGYFETAAEDKPLLHTWSLAVEEQFYVVFPLLLLLLWRRGTRATLTCIAVTSLLSLVSSEWMQRSDPTGNFFLAPSRAWELMAGSMAAYWVQYRRRVPNDLLALLGLVLIVSAIVVYDHSTPFPGIYAVPPVLGTMLIVLFSGGPGLITRFLSSRILVAIGLISYSAYLWHQPLFAFARLRAQAEPEPHIMLALAILSLFLAWFSWRWIEQPARERKGLLKTRTGVFVFSGLISIVLIILGIVGHKANGFESRFSRIVHGETGYEEMHKTLNARFSDCESTTIRAQSEKWGTFTRCKQSQPGSPGIILLGDSHAEHLFLGLAESMPDASMAYYIRDGHLSLGDSVFKVIVRELMESEKSLSILVSMYYMKRFEESPEARIALFELLDALQKSGHKITLLGDVPAFPIHPEKCVFVNEAGREPRSCSISVQDIQAQLATYEATLKNISSQLSVPFIPLHEPLCQSGRCGMVSAGQILYSDIHHLNPMGSRVVGAYLAKRLQQSD
jgi:peptidoglycan/LPS O-acetylase OafA/YrhL